MFFSLLNPAPFCADNLLTTKKNVFGLVVVVVVLVVKQSTFLDPMGITKKMLLPPEHWHGANSTHSATTSRQMQKCRRHHHHHHPKTWTAMVQQFRPSPSPSQKCLPKTLSDFPTT